MIKTLLMINRKRTIAILLVIRIGPLKIDKVGPIRVSPKNPNVFILIPVQTNGIIHNY